jgi:hypothetical protein
MFDSREREPGLSFKDRLLIAGAGGAVLVALILSEVLDGPVPTIVDSHSCEFRDAPAKGEHLEQFDRNPERFKNLFNCTVNGREYAIVPNK